MLRILHCNNHFVFVVCNLCNVKGLTQPHFPNGCPQCYDMGFTKVAIEDIPRQIFAGRDFEKPQKEKSRKQ